MCDGNSFDPIRNRSRGQGVGATTGGRRLLFRFRGRLAFSLVEFPLAGLGVAALLAFALPVVARFAFAFWFWLRFAPAFAFALAFLLSGFFLALAFAAELLLISVFRSEVEFVFVFEFSGVELSPLAVARLMSTATVCPTFTISPACGNWIKTVSGFASDVARVARTRKFRPASLMVLSAAARSFPTTSGTRVSELRSDK